MLIKVIPNPPVIIPNSTLYHRYKEIILIIEGLPLQLP